MKNVCRLTVRGYELDSFGHVNNSVYLQYAETAMWDFFSKHGMLDKIQDEGLFPVILESKQRYIHELKLMDKVLIETDMSFSGGVVKYSHKIFNEGSGQLACRVSGKLVYVNRERIICDIPESLKNLTECDLGED